MKKFIKALSTKIHSITSMIKKTAINCMVKMEIYKANAKMSLCNQRGDQNVSTAITILISIVIGALLLAGLYMLFEDVVMPTITKKIQEMFEYKG